MVLLTGILQGLIIRPIARKTEVVEEFIKMVFNSSNDHNNYGIAEKN